MESVAREIRLSDAERDFYEGLLEAAVRAGMLNLDEFEERLDALYQVHNATEAAALIPAVGIPGRGPDRSRRKRVAGLLGAATLVACLLATVAETRHAASPATPVAQHHTQSGPDESTTAASGLVTTRIPASCVTYVPYEQTETAWLNQQYVLLRPADPAPCIHNAGLRLGVRPRDSEFEHVHLDLVLDGGALSLRWG